MEIKILGSFICGLGAIILVVGYFIARTLRQYDESISNLYKKCEKTKGELDTLLGAHNAIFESHKGLAKDD